MTNGIVLALDLDNTLFLHNGKNNEEYYSFIRNFLYEKKIEGIKIFILSHNSDPYDMINHLNIGRLIDGVFNEKKNFNLSIDAYEWSIHEFTPKSKWLVEIFKSLSWVSDIIFVDDVQYNIDIAKTIDRVTCIKVDKEVGIDFSLINKNIEICKNKRSFVNFDTISWVLDWVYDNRKMKRKELGKDLENNLKKTLVEEKYTIYRGIPCDSINNISDLKIDNVSIENGFMECVIDYSCLSAWTTFYSEAEYFSRESVLEKLRDKKPGYRKYSIVFEITVRKEDLVADINRTPYKIMLKQTRNKNHENVSETGGEVILKKGKYIAKIVKYVKN